MFYLHNNWYVKAKCQIEWMDGKAGLQQSKNLVTASMGEWMNGWMNEWMNGIKLNYNGGTFSKMVRFLKFKFLIL